MQFKDIEAITHGVIIKDCYSLIKGYATNSKGPLQNKMFIPLKGKKYDGHDFISDAIANGAMAILIADSYQNKEELLASIKDSDLGIIQVADTLEALKNIASYKRDNYRGKVIAITGSNGKTSTKEMAYQVFKTKYKTFKTKDNQNNIIGVSEMLLQLNDEDIALIEVGMNHLGEISEISKILKPHIGIITNIGSAHIGNLGSKENILKAKLEILDGMNNEGVLIANGNDDYLKNINCPLKVLYFNTDDSTYQVKNDKITFNYLKQEYVVNGIGLHNLANSLAVIKLASLFDMDYQHIYEGLNNYHNEDGRMKKMMVGKTVVIDDTYNASFESFKNGIDYLNSTPISEKIVVVGDMLELGEYSRDLHQELGLALVDSKINKIYTIGEYAYLIGQYSTKEHYHFPSKEALLNNLKPYLQDDTIVYFKASRKIGLDEIIRKL